MEMIFTCVIQRGNHRKWSIKKVFLEISQNSQEITGARDSFLIKLQAYNFIKNESLAQVFSCEFCKISKSTIFYRKPLVAASAHERLILKFSQDLQGKACDVALFFYKNITLVRVLFFEIGDFPTCRSIKITSRKYF